MEYPLNQSAWRRGWNTTKAVWTNWQFYVLDAVVAVVIGGIFGWYWGFAIVAFGMFCVWIGATASAPIKQRNEARALLLIKPKPVPLSNRKELINAIHQLKETARETIWRNDIAKTKREVNDPNGYMNALADYHVAYVKYDEAEKRLECEKDIAGGMFEEPIKLFQNTMKFHVLGRELPTMPTYSEVLTQLDNAVKEIVRTIDHISQ